MTQFIINYYIFKVRTNTFLLVDKHEKLDITENVRE